MEIPLLDLKAQYKTIKKEINEAIKHVLDSQNFILSGEVDALEREVSDYVGVPFAAGVASGTDALILALRVLGIGKGDSVITTPLTFIATVEAISQVGARPIFVDIDPLTYNIDPGKIEELLQSSEVRSQKSEVRRQKTEDRSQKSEVRRQKTEDRRQKTEVRRQGTIKAIIPVHLYGQCADMTEIMKIANKYNLRVIEDCAQAMGAEHQGKMAGSFGDLGCHSFFPSKNLGGFGDGGMVVSRDRNLIEHIKKLRVHGASRQYVHAEIGYNSRLDSLQASILQVKLKKLDKWLERKRIIAKRYNAAFKMLDITIPKVSGENIHTYHLYTIAVDNRDELLEHLNKNGVEARVYYPVPMHLQPCYKNLGCSEGSFPGTEKAVKRILSLPIYPELRDKEIQYIIHTVKEFYK